MSRATEKRMVEELSAPKDSRGKGPGEKELREPSLFGGGGLRFRGEE
jgi:hypothetical protein